MKRFFKWLLCGILPLVLAQCGGGDSRDDDENSDQKYERTNLDYTIVSMTGLSSSNGIDSITLDTENRTVLLNGEFYSSGNMTWDYQQLRSQYTLVINSSDDRGGYLYCQFRINYTKATKNRTRGDLTYWTVTRDGVTAYGTCGNIEVSNKY